MVVTVGAGSDTGMYRVSADTSGTMPILPFVEAYKVSRAQPPPSPTLRGKRNALILRLIKHELTFQSQDIAHLSRCSGASNDGRSNKLIKVDMDDKTGIYTDFFYIGAYCSVMTGPPPTQHGRWPHFGRDTLELLKDVQQREILWLL